MKPNSRLFVRDDDVGPLTDELRLFVETFISRRIPVSYQIIPARFTQEAADFLLDVWSRYPDLIEFGQHGLKHEMMVRGRRDLREFGPEKSLAEQKADIAEGLEILRTRLKGGPDVRVFTPPRHKYNRDTILAVAAAGHTVFSAAFYPTAHHRLAYRLGRRLGMSSIRHHGISYHGRLRPEAPVAELSISVAVDDGIDLLCPGDSIAGAIRVASANDGTVGLMFHHDLYGTPERAAELRLLADRLAAPDLSCFQLLTEIADAAG